MAAKAINIEFTVNAWAKALGTTEATLKSKLTKADLPNTGLIPARHVFSALHGEKEASVIRLNNARADKEEQEKRVRDGELVEIVPHQISKPAKGKKREYTMAEKAKWYAELLAYARQHGRNPARGSGPQPSSRCWNTSPACSRSAWNLILGQLLSMARSSGAYSTSTVGASTAS